MTQSQNPPTVDPPDASAPLPPGLDPALADAADALVDGEDPVVPALLKLTGNYSLDHKPALDLLGVVVTTTIGPIATITFPLRSARALAELPFVVKLEGAQPMLGGPAPHND